MLYICNIFLPSIVCSFILKIAHRIGFRIASLRSKCSCLWYSIPITMEKQESMQQRSKSIRICLGKKTRFRAIALQNWFVWYPFRYFNNWLLMLPERFSDRCRDLYGCQLFPLIPKRIQSIENINETKSSLRRCCTLHDSPLLSVRLYYVGNNISNIISLENGFSVKKIA